MPGCARCHSHTRTNQLRMCNQRWTVTTPGLPSPEAAIFHSRNNLASVDESFLQTAILWMTSSYVNPNCLRVNYTVLNNNNNKNPVNWSTWHFNMNLLCFAVAFFWCSLTQELSLPGSLSLLLSTSKQFPSDASSFSDFSQLIHLILTGNSKSTWWQDKPSLLPWKLENVFIFYLKKKN